MRKHRATLGVAALAGTSLALWPGAQQEAKAYYEASAYVVDDHIVYDGGVGLANDVTVTRGDDPTEFVIEDEGAFILDFDGCTGGPGDQAVTCTIPAEHLDHAYISADLNEEDDTYRGSDIPDDVSGEGGDDTIYGEGGDDTLHGGDGNDVLHGGPGADEIDGGPGDDEIVD
jgi:Ca2+-binding RTX toxin-like protein